MKKIKNWKTPAEVISYHCHDLKPASIAAALHLRLRHARPRADLDPLGGTAIGAQPLRPPMPSFFTLELLLLPCHAWAQAWPIDAILHRRWHGGGAWAQVPWLYFYPGGFLVFFISSSMNLFEVYWAPAQVYCANGAHRWLLDLLTAGNRENWGERKAGGARTGPRRNIW